MLPRYDVAIVGGSIAGCATALACAKRGARVLVLEAETDSHADRSGQWLHPNAMDALENLDVDLKPPVGYPTGKGFVVFPEDGTESIVLPYRFGRFGFSLSHSLLVETLRAHCAQHDAIDFESPARALWADSVSVRWEQRSTRRTATFGRLVCAAGANTQALWESGDRWIFGEVDRAPTHRIANLELVGLELPFEGYRHLFIGGPGPAVAQRVAPAVVHLALDVPLSFRVTRRGAMALFDAYAPALPDELVEPFAEALRRSAPAWTHGRIQPRTKAMARRGLARIGDAAGSVHPLTAVGPDLAIADATSFADSKTTVAYARSSRRFSRVPEAIAVGLAELFTDDAPESVALRRATYHTWRSSSRERLQSMAYIAGDSGSVLRFGSSCVRVMLSGALTVASEGARTRRPQYAHRVGSAMLRRMGWMVGGSLGWTDLLPAGLADRLEARGATRFGDLMHRASEGEVVGLPSSRSSALEAIDTALKKGVNALIAEQAEDGSFEWENVWCPMLPAQYVLACHIMDIPISEARRKHLLRHFEITRVARGGWGMHEKSKPYLYVTTLVYVASRLLGVSKDDPLLADAKEFIREEGGAIGIPSWGKLWLSLVGLYEWEGVNPVVPELWSTPRWSPIHPSRYYCHVRLIYLGMASLYGARVTRTPTPTIRCIRDEIYNEPYETVDFASGRNLLRADDVHDRPGVLLRLAYSALVQFERTRTPTARKSVLSELRERIRYDLRSTNYTCLSPVSGLLGMIALHHADPQDPDLLQGLDALDGWIWEDENEGARVAGARSATWDTSFAMQALAEAAPHVNTEPAIRSAEAFLATQQIRTATGREIENDRLPPVGGYCFAGVWHGWPVSDCTAEAMLARLHSPYTQPSRESMTKAAEFIMQCQNPDGGFGSYEARRDDLFRLDWLNPSEMFGACMTERSYVECTSSCITALAEFHRRFPEEESARVRSAIERGVGRLRAAQRPDGSFEGMWGVNFIYGTMFGVRGLLAGGVPSTDPQVRRACTFLLGHQRPDGGWGEHFDGVIERRYVEHEEGQVVQSAWALTALLEANEPDFPALQRGAEFLERMQKPDGTWPKQDPEGIFFHTALVEYRAYRAYFPPWALGLFVTRAKARATRRKGGRPPRTDLRPLAG